MNRNSNTQIQMIADFEGDASVLIQEREAGIYPTLCTRDLVVVSEACMLGFYLIRQCGVKTVERKQPKRYLLSFAKHRYNGMENTIKTMTDSEGNRSEWYAKLRKNSIFGKG
jgi:hypothetical protein